LAPVLIGTGAFLAAAGLLVRLYVAEQLIVAPVNLYRVTTLQATNASYFDEAMLAEVNGATVTATNTLRGDVRASTHTTAVWDSFLVVQAPASQTDLVVQSRVSVFNRRTAELTNGHGAAINGNTKIHQSGIGYFWPIGLKKQTYSYFDATTGRAWPMVYSGTAVVHGIHVYRFVQHVPSTVEGAGLKVPGWLLHLNGQSVPARQHYTSTVTVWVDPRTGVPVNQENQIRTTLVADDGSGQPLTVANLDLKMSAAGQSSLASYSQKQEGNISLLRVIIPIGGVVLGVLAFAFGLVMSLRRRGVHSADTRSTLVTSVPAAGDADGNAPK
jgi:hypothetical protein